MQGASAKSCTFAHVQVPRSYQDLISRSYFYITSYLQVIKCKIFHISTCPSIKFLPRPNFYITSYLQGAKCKILLICTRASIKFLSRPNFFITPYMQGASEKSCTFTHVQVPRTYQDLISRSYFYITSYMQGA